MSIKRNISVCVLALASAVGAVEGVHQAIKAHQANKAADREYAAADALTDSTDMPPPLSSNRHDEYWSHMHNGSKALDQIFDHKALSVAELSLAALLGLLGANLKLKENRPN